jgi:hypothetical protein
VLPVASGAPGAARLLLSSRPGRPDGAIDGDALTLAPDEGVLIAL